jgi:hypothetical protein
MANFKSLRAAGPAFMPVDGCGMFITDKYTFASNMADGDTLDFRIPGGMEVVGVQIQCDDLDTDAIPEIVFGAGYTPVDAASSLSPSLEYFAAAGQLTAGTGGRLECSFKPIKFEEDVWLRITIATNAQTFAAGDIAVIVSGNGVGQK